MKTFNIYLTGAGGQGIGLLSEILLRGADHAGLKVKGVDTHGLAQRGGIVVSNIRLGESLYSPLIAKNEADLAVALERHEALRCINTALKKSSTLIYYNNS
jgi:indolepyruvate ferredoxin oxidoreductase beta subunit